MSAWSTATTIAESPLVPGVLWVGTDDGNIQLSRDGGTTWSEVSRNLPGGTTRYYVSRVEASHHDPATAYVSIDGHKSDDLAPYVYVTRDFGASWTSITADLPEVGNVNTIRQDPRNEDVLYVGTEFGFFVSLDHGQSWERFMNGLPVVRIDDVVVHPRDNDLVLATHGRSIWIMDDVTPLQMATSDVLADAVHLFEPREAVQWLTDRRTSRSVTGDKNWLGDSAPEGVQLSYWLGSAGSDVSIVVSDPVSGEVVRSLDGTARPGLNRVLWDLRGEPSEVMGRNGARTVPGAAVPPGVYRVELTAGAVQRTTTVRVLEDVWMR